MDTNDVDVSLHEIEQMALVAVNAHESLVGSDTALVFPNAGGRFRATFL
jgi:hypothetical protein